MSNDLLAGAARGAVVLWLAAWLCACAPDSEQAGGERGTVAPESDAEARSGGSRQAPSTRRMAGMLAGLAARTNPSLAMTAAGTDARVAQLREMQAGSPPGRRMALQDRIAYELLRGGRTEEAIREALVLRDSVQAGGDGDAGDARKLLATAYLRLGEQENCIARHGPQSCLMPLQGDGIHRNQRGSRMAVEELAAMLGADPTDLASRWLYNLAFMTLGEWPDGVPERWRISPSVFESEYPLPRFENVAGRMGVDVLGLSGGVVLEDLDGDDRLDLMVSAWGLEDPLRFFHNTGQGRFEERSGQAGLAGEVGGLNLVHADYDNDGDADVLVLRGAWLGAAGRFPNSLLRNDGAGHFEDVTEQAGLLSLRPTQTAAWGDYNNDGWLDLFIGNESTPDSPHPCELFRGNGDGTFTEVAVEAGVANVGFVKAVAWGDYDDDGRIDLYLSRFGETNVLYRNDGPQGDRWSFSDVTAAAGVAEPLQSFPAWWWDFDNDGRLDLFVAPFPGFDGDNLAAIAAAYLGRPSVAERPRLYHNRGDGTFAERSAATGLDDPMLAMGANFGDLDNDGFVDAYIGTGEPNLRSLVPNRMYRNDSGRRFAEVTTAGGFGHLQKGHGIAFGDLDDDGDQDIYAVMGGAYVGDVAHNTLFLNPGGGGRWITLRLEGRRANRSAVGARVRARVRKAGGVRDVHAVVGTGGSFGSSSLQVELGLGAALGIEELEIRWPGSGRVTRLTDVEIDRVHRIVEEP